MCDGEGDRGDVRCEMGVMNFRRKDVLQLI